MLLPLVVSVLWQRLAILMPAQRRAYEREVS
jgi:hypothetical protein